ncbi:unnamed protein product [Prorocentrum cordatum]|uniref:Uncharacterized protein n=1 Tax=Prorocentrum cordatum TaxID=2364126 RepID=A0ABN9V9Q0_9DINO|nr:unnamed protein product [Polarella glacialis]
MNKRVWYQEHVAHSGRVLCARLGDKSGQVLATGGDDKRVNIWKVSKPNAMMSLTGHSTPVESVVFDKQEEVLVVGCTAGSMQAWQGKGDCRRVGGNRAKVQPGTSAQAPYLFLPCHTLVWFWYPHSMAPSIQQSSSQPLLDLPHVGYKVDANLCSP